MRIMNGQFPSIEQVTDTYFKQQGNRTENNRTEVKDFGEVLSSLKFSKHAAYRLQDRNIELSDSQIDRLNAGITAQPHGLYLNRVFYD